MNYLNAVDEKILSYFSILEKDFPMWLNDYINADVLLKQSKISVTCGTMYTNLCKPDIFYSSLDHSIGVALVIWHFTHDKEMTLAGLFHDISTPVFKHCIDFMNKDYLCQESTEELTLSKITSSKKIMQLLRNDNIDISKVCNYHMYPVADNNLPHLCADRLEYTFSNGLGQCQKLWSLEDVKNIYKDISILDGELGFINKDSAEKFTNVACNLALIYMDDVRRFSMQFLADLMKNLSNENVITIKDLYELSESQVIEIIKNSKYSECFKKWSEGEFVYASSTKPKDVYYVNVPAKKRYIDPIVKIDDKICNISNLSHEVRENIQKCQSYTFDRYIYMDFNLNEKQRVRK